MRHRQVRRHRNLIAAALFIAVGAQAGELDDIAAALRPQVARLMRKTVPPPLIRWASAQEIFEQCRCTAKSMFSAGVVRLHVTVDAYSKEGQALIVHELVHWVQFLERGNAASCAEWLEREGAAFVIEQLWRSQNGVRMPPLPGYRCKDWG